MSTPKEQLQERMLHFLERLEPEGGSELSPSIPEFDYYALDYLDFAEMNLRRIADSPQTREAENDLTSCITNLKLALDCQIECFLSLWGLRKVFDQRNLSIKQKLEFLKEIGIVSSQTITRFTTIRNKMEHEFKRPKITDLESLFDLVTAVVAILQMTASFKYIVEFTLHSEESEELDENFPRGIGFFILSYDDKHLKFVAKWHFYTDPPSQNDCLEAPLSSLSDFVYFFRVLLLLNQFDAFASYDHIRTRLKA